MLLRLAMGAARWCDRVIPVFYPDSSGLKLFRILVLLVCTYITTFIPLQMAFYRQLNSLDPEASPLKEFNILIDVLCILALLVKAHTGFFDRGHYMGRTAAAAIHYGCDEFPLDLISAFPYPWL
eukprot:404523-Prymnesium_polylepis.1